MLLTKLFLLKAAGETESLGIPLKPRVMDLTTSQTDPVRVYVGLALVPVPSENS